MMKLKKLHKHQEKKFRPTCQIYLDKKKKMGQDWSIPIIK